MSLSELPGLVRELAAEVDCRTVLAKLAVHVCIFDLSVNCFVYQNRPLEEELGYEAGDTRLQQIGQTATFLHPDDLESIPSTFSILNRMGDEDVIERHWRFVRADGEYQPYRVSARVYRRTTDGRPRQVLMVLSEDCYRAARA